MELEWGINIKVNSESKGVLQWWSPMITDDGLMGLSGPGSQLRSYFNSLGKSETGHGTFSAIFWRYMYMEGPDQVHLSKCRCLFLFICETANPYNPGNRTGGCSDYYGLCTYPQGSGFRAHPLHPISHRLLHTLRVPSTTSPNSGEGLGPSRLWRPFCYGSPQFKSYTTRILTLPYLQIKTFKGRLPLLASAISTTCDYWGLLLYFSRSSTHGASSERRGTTHHDRCKLQYPIRYSSVERFRGAVQQDA